MNLNEQKQIVKWVKIVVLKTLREKNLTRLDVETLISAGLLGYSQARTRFDNSRGVKFKTFAEYRIKGAVLDEVRKMIGDERAKTPRAKRVEEYDYNLISDDNTIMSNVESQLDVNVILKKTDLAQRDLKIIHARIAGLSIKELAIEFKFSESRASQLLARIKRTLADYYKKEFGMQFNLVTIVCPKCKGETLISDKSLEYEFNCDHCDGRLKFINGEIEVEDELEEIEPE